MDKSAVVHAPSTEKARTVFLDWLERNNLIPRADRHRWRRNMVAEKLEDPGEVESDIELWYGYEEEPTAVYTLSREEFESPSDLEEEFVGDAMVGSMEEEGDVLEEHSEKPSRKLPPIAEAALRGF
jgi:hypothetical protein